MVPISYERELFALSHVTSLQSRSGLISDLKSVIKTGLDKRFSNFCIKPNILINVLKIISKCSWKLSLEPRISTRSFCDAEYST